MTKTARHPKMISPSQALDIISDAVPHGRGQDVPIDRATGRICAKNIHAALTHPPFNSSAMDGYAVRFEDVKQIGAALSVIGEAPAGTPFDGEIGKGQALRIFTGSVVPQGADHVIIQEDVNREGNDIIVTTTQTMARNIRFAGTDFKQGDLIKAAGTPISAIDSGWLAGANIASVPAIQKPIVAYFDNGDELVEPGQARARGQIIGSNRFALEGLIASWGGQPVYLGRAADSADAVKAMFARGVEKADIITPIGGASVGDHDYVRGAFKASGGELLFEKIAVKPGKPTWFGQIEGSPYVLGLPGNPASAIVCAILFLKPLIERLSGQVSQSRFVTAKLNAPIRSNGPRETYLRAVLSLDAQGQLWAMPADLQDSSLMSRLARSNGLIKCPPHMAAKDKGDSTACLLYGSLA